MKNKIIKQYLRRQHRVRSKIVRQSDFPRLTVYRSHKFIYAQVIDDFEGKTLASAQESKSKKLPGTKSERAKLIGKELAEKLTALKIKQVVFDRGGYAYNGRIKALAESVRENGITI